MVFKVDIDIRSRGEGDLSGDLTQTEAKDLVKFISKIQKIEEFLIKKNKTGRGLEIAHGLQALRMTIQTVAEHGPQNIYLDNNQQTQLSDQPAHTLTPHAEVVKKIPEFSAIYYDKTGEPLEAMGLTTLKRETLKAFLEQGKERANRDSEVGKVGDLLDPVIKIFSQGANLGLS